MELQSIQDVQLLKDIAIFKTDVECAQSVTPLFSFKPWNKIYLNKPKQNISVYSNFIAPTPNKIGKLLGQVDSVMY